MCGQYDCVSRLGAFGQSVSSSAQPAADAGGNGDDLQPAQRRHSSRAPTHPQLLAQEQAAERELAAANRQINRMEAAEQAVAQQQAAPAPALPPHVEPAQFDTQLPTVADIASHRPLYDMLSYALQPLWRDICTPAFERYRQASTAKDLEYMAAALVSILQLPAKHLVKQRVPARIRRRFQRLQLKASDWQAQRLRDQLRDAQGLAAAQAASQRQREVSNALSAEHDRKYNTDSEPEAEHESELDLSDDNTHDDSQAILRARRLVAAGHLDVASRAVMSTNKTLDCADPAVMRQLRAMHPPASAVPMPPLPLNTPEPPIENNSELRRLVQRCDNGKAGGPSGWNGAMIAVLADSQTCMEGLRCILQDISGGHIPLAIRPHITATRLIALAKPNNTPRPIAMAELFYRMAAVRAVRSVMDVTAQLLGPHQYGVGVSAGCEHIIHCMQHSLSHIGVSGPQAAIKVCVLSTGSSTSRIPAVKGVSMVQARNILSHSSPVNPVPLLFLPC